MTYTAYRPPQFRNGLRVTPYHGGLVRIDVRAPGGSRGIDITAEDFGNDAALGEALAPLGLVTVADVRSYCG